MPLLKTSNLTTNASTEGVYCDGGPVWVSASGDLDGGSLLLEVSLDREVSYAPLTLVNSSGELVPVSLTEDAALQLSLPDCYVRGTLSGATDPDVVLNFNKLSPKF